MSQQLPRNRPVRPVKSSLTVIGYPKLARANASAALAYIYRPGARRKIAAPSHPPGRRSQNAPSNPSAAPARVSQAPSRRSDQGSGLNLMPGLT